MGIHRLIGLPFTFWFLSTLFVCSLSYCGLYKVGIKNTIAQTLLLALFSLTLPNCEFIKFFIPFFGIGLILARVDFINIKFTWLHIGILAIFIVTFYVLFWNSEFYIYKTKNPIFTEFIPNRWYAYFARIILGSSIALWLIILFRKLESQIRIGWVSTIARTLSRNSLALYVMHYSLFQITSHYCSVQYHLSSSVSTILMLFVAIILIEGFNLLISIIRKNSLLKMLFLGERDVKQNNLTKI